MRQMSTLVASRSTAVGQSVQARQGATRAARSEEEMWRGVARAWPRLQREPRLLLRHVVHHDAVLHAHAAADRERRARGLCGGRHRSAPRGVPCAACARLRGAGERHRSEHIGACTASSRAICGPERGCVVSLPACVAKKAVQPFSARRSPCAAPQGNQRQLRGALARAAVEMPVAAAFCGAPGHPAVRCMPAAAFAPAHFAR